MSELAITRAAYLLIFTELFREIGVPVERLLERARPCPLGAKKARMPMSVFRSPSIGLPAAVGTFR